MLPDLLLRRADFFRQIIEVNQRSVYSVLI